MVYKGLELFIDTARCDALCRGLQSRVEMLVELVNVHTPQYSTDNQAADVTEILLIAVMLRINGTINQLAKIKNIILNKYLVQSEQDNEQDIEQDIMLL